MSEYESSPGSPLHWQDNYYFHYIHEMMKSYSASNKPSPKPNGPENAIYKKYKEVKEYAESHSSDFQTNSIAENSDAAALLDKILAEHGISGVYSFFRALSNDEQELSPGARKDRDKFIQIVKEIVVPHFESYTSDVVHGASVVGHGTIAALGGAPHLPETIISAVSLGWSLNSKVKNRRSPKLEIVEKMLPVLTSMHELAQQLVCIFKKLKPETSLPDIPSPDSQILSDSLNACKFQDKPNSATHLKRL